MAVEGNIIGAATLSMTQSLALFGSFLPKFSDIGRANPDVDTDIVKDVRLGELAAVLMTLGIGGMTSALTGSAVPSVVALLTCGGLVMLYEYALRSKGVSNA